MSFNAPSKGLVFWPVGTGDSTTVFINDKVIFQIDLHHMQKSDDENESQWQIIDQLEEILPKRNGIPYLSAFALTHADLDHCKGFSELLERVTIGEIWFTPHIFTEVQKELGEEAKAFRKEAMRRVKETIKNPNAASGDRVRIVGFDKVLENDDFNGFPKEKLSIPGHEIFEVDGEDLSDDVRFFIHSPFKDDLREDRNDTSLGLQVKLIDGEDEGRALLFGDLAYESLKRIFDVTSNDDNLLWDVLLAPHHCSKKVMYIRNDSGDILKQDIMDCFKNKQNGRGYIISSSMPIKERNQSGENPPHAKAKNRYEEIVRGDFICTHEHPDENNPEPIVFEVGENGFTYVGTSGKFKGSLKQGVAAARGSDSPPIERVGYGQHRIN